MSAPEAISDSEQTSAEATANRLLEVVRDIVTELHPRQAAPGTVSLDSALDRDLALDSLGRVELLARIEKTFDVSLPEAAFANAETPRDLLRAIVGATGRRDAVAASEVADVSLGEARGAPPSAETLVDVLRWHVASHPERPHVRLYEDEGDGTVITYRGLLEGAERIAAGLQAHDLQPGEAVAIMLPTGAEYFMSFFGTLIAGGIPIPVYPPARLAQVEEHMRRHAVILANAAAAILVTVPEAQRFAGFLMSGVDSLRHVVTPDELTATTAAPMTPAIGAQDTAFLQYTSGSTGNPKGVVLTHANLVANIQAMTMVLETTPDDVVVSWLPLYHDMGLIGAWLGSLHQAMPLVIMSPLSFLARPRRWLWAIHRYRGTLSAAPNFAYELCLRRIDDADIEGLDLSSWRMAANGAEAVSPDTVESFCDRFADHGFRRETMMPMFGLAENCVGLAFPPLDRGPLIDRIERRTLMEAGRALPSDDAGALRVVACGRPLPGHQVRIVDENDRELPERQEGRLQFTGPSATGGYFRNLEATRELFHGDWLDSGDLAYVAAGDVYITGRRKDVIIRGGRNVYPAELEEAVGDLEGVRSGNVAVFASTDADTGTERLIVVAETRKTDARARDDLTARINALAQDLIAMPPDDVVLAPPNTVPKTSSGKIRRAACRELFEGDLIGKPRRSIRLQVARLALASAVAWVRRAADRFAAGLYALYGWCVLLLVAVPTWLLVAVLPVGSWRWAVVRWFSRTLFSATGVPITVHGRENLPAAGTPYIFVSNHMSYLDSPVLTATLPGPYSFVAKAELLDQFVPRVFLKRIGTEFVERFDARKGVEDAKRIAEIANSGRPLLYFAEGTLTRMPGLLPFHMGAFQTAVEAGLPVIPIAIRGTRSILRDQSAFPRRGAVTVVIDRPIDPASLAAEAGDDLWTRAIRLRDATRDRILRLCGEPDLGHERPLAELAPPIDDE